jgi:hypothetical protein
LPKKQATISGGLSKSSFEDGDYNPVLGEDGVLVNLPWKEHATGMLNGWF